VLEVSRAAQCNDFLTYAHGKLPLNLPDYGCQVIQIDAPK
jgi:hypothetical protein